MPLANARRVKNTCTQKLTPHPRPPGEVGAGERCFCPGGLAAAYEVVIEVTGEGGQLTMAEAEHVTC